MIISKEDKKVSIFELTVPSEPRIKISNKIKFEKYEHFQDDIKNFEVAITPFEIGAQQGYISHENKSNINKLHKFSKPSIKLKTFKNNISAIATLSSYYIFNLTGSHLTLLMNHSNEPT